jgi:hypothetical protein
MGYRLELKVGNRIVYSHSYPSEKKAKAAIGRTRGATGKVIRS